MKTIKDVVEEMRLDIKWPADRSNRSVYEVDSNVQIHVLTPGKLRCLATLWSWQCWILQLLL